MKKGSKKKDKGRRKIKDKVNFKDTEVKRNGTRMGEVLLPWGTPPNPQPVGRKKFVFFGLFIAFAIQTQLQVGRKGTTTQG